MPSVKIEDWGGGITDEYIDAAPIFSKKLHDVFLNIWRKPIQRWGTEIYNSSAPQIPPGNQRIDSCYYFDSTLFVKSGTKLYLIKDGDTSWTTLATVSSKDAFADSEVGAKCSWSEWKGHLFATPHPGSTKKAGCRTIKIYRSAASTWACVRAGMPRMQDATSGGLEVSGSGDENFVAYNVWYRTYNAVVDGNTVTFEDYGKPESREWTYEDRASAEDGTRDWTNPTLDSYDDTNLKIRVFRTKNNDSVPLYSHQENQGAQINYPTADDDLGAEAYFAAGVLYWDPIPLCYYSDIVESTGFYAAGVDIDGGNFYYGRVWQSHPGNPNAVPAGNYCDVPGKIKGLTHFGINPIVFTEKRAWRLEGRFDAYGGGKIVAKEISAVEGCVSADSIVRTPEGVFWASENGWCWTDGFKVENLTQHLATTYGAISNKSTMTGCYDSKNRRVFWACDDRTLNPAGTASQNSCWYVLDLRHSGRNERGELQGCFTTMGYREWVETNSLHYDQANDRIIMGSFRGYLLKLDKTKTTDLVVDTAAAYSTWARHAVLWSYWSPSFSFGSALVTKLMTRLQIVAKNLSSSFSADLYSYRDDESSATVMKEIRDRTAAASGLHKVWRWFKKGALRCRYRQVRFDKGWVNMFRSDDESVATVNSAAKTVLLSVGSWPNEVGYDLRWHYISFATDGYVAEYRITADSGNTLTLHTAPAGNPAGVEWVIRGYPKTESVELRAIEIEYDLEELTTRAYQAGSDGSND